MYCVVQIFAVKCNINYVSAISFSTGSMFRFCRATLASGTGSASWLYINILQHNNPMCSVNSNTVWLMSAPTSVTSCYMHPGVAPRPRPRVFRWCPFMCHRNLQHSLASLPLEARAGVSESLLNRIQIHPLTTAPFPPRESVPCISRF